MEWFSRRTSIAGVQIPNWGIALGAVIVILLSLNRSGLNPVTVIFKNGN